MNLDALISAALFVVVVAIVTGSILFAILRFA